VTTEPSVGDSPPSPAAVKLSPIEQMRRKAAEKGAAAAGVAGADNAASSGVVAAPVTAESGVADSLPSPAAVKLSPIEQMRRKAAEKAAAAAGGAAAAVGAASDVAASAGIVAAPATAVAGVTDSPPSSSPARLSPLELMRQKAAQSVAVPSGGTPAVPVVKAAPGALVSKPAAVGVVGTGTGGGQSGGRASSGGNSNMRSGGESLPSASADEKRVLWDFYVNLVRPYLVERGSGGVVRRSRLAVEMEANRVFHAQEALLPAVLHPVLLELRESCEVRRQLERQRTLLRWMHWWLMLHVPVSVLLLVFLAAHVLMALRVVPLEF
jgi:hypothetical protein